AGRRRRRGILSMVSPELGDATRAVKMRVGTVSPGRRIERGTASRAEGNISTESEEVVEVAGSENKKEENNIKNKPEKFTLVVNFGGYFVKCGPIMEYLTGTLKSIYGLDADRFGYFDLQEELQKLGVKKYEKIVYRIHDASLGADSLRDVTDDKGVMEIISCGKNKRTVIQIYVVGGDIIDDEADENAEDREEVNGLSQTQSESQRDEDDGEEVNGLSQTQSDSQKDEDDGEEVNGLNETKSDGQQGKDHMEE
ncbi:Unknown protein, partial [Striga hermonthica]